jgi:type I restriction enzyme R subunit
MKPEEKARQRIDKLLDATGWSVQSMSRLNLSAALSVAVREFPVESGFADYVLFVDRQAVGVIEAKAIGTTLSGVAEQSEVIWTTKGTKPTKCFRGFRAPPRPS